MWRKVKFFFIKYWVIIAVFLTMFVSIALPWWVLSRIDSYQRIYLMAWLSIMPIQSIVSGAIFVILLYWLHYGGGFQKINKAHVRPSDVNIRWDDVIGMDQAKMEAKEVVKLIKDHVRVKQIGGKMLRGLLMMGPPGCGKTYLAKAIATESGVPFLAMSGSEFVEMYVGVGASRVRQIFKKARMLAEEHGGCVIFLDEMDTVGRKRVFNAFGGSEETNSTLNQLLAEMDGLGTAKNNIVVIGATNAAETTLDEALLRPGRFDRKLIIQRPDAIEREQIFRFYLSKIKFDGTLDIARIARRAVYKSPADINNIVQEAALISARDGKAQVDYKDIMNAMDRIELGFKHKLKMSRRELEMTAYHETGHAVVLYYLHPDEEPNYATIIRRGAALGHVQHLPIEELYSKDKDAMLADIKVSVAGYVAERFKFGVTTTGVSADFQHAINTAHVMVWRLGMGKSSYVGDFTAIPKAQIADEIKHRLNLETQEILDECVKDVQALLEREKEVFERFALELIEKEELYYDEIQEIFKTQGSQHPRRLRRKPGEAVL